MDSNGGVCRHGEVGRNGCCFSRSVVPPFPANPSLSDPFEVKRSPLSLQEGKVASGSTSVNPSNDAASSYRPPTADGAHSDSSSPTFEDSVPSIVPTCSAEHQCCSQYEFCVSSCMDFTWQRIRKPAVSPSTNSNEVQSIERLLGEHQADDDNVAKEYSGTTDLFDWCLLRCRTSGRSVVHQNSFRSTLKHCYGLKDPPLLARNVEKGETE